MKKSELFIFLIFSVIFIIQINPINAQLNECESYGYSCVNSSQCLPENLNATLLCSGLSKICCTKKETCQNIGGIICDSDEHCEDHEVSSFDSNRCCLTSCLIIEEEINTCEDGTSICSKACPNGYQEKIFGKCYEEAICCSPITKVQESKSLFRVGINVIDAMIILLLIIVILLVSYILKLKK